jgi:hypothetical protein
VIGVTSSVAVCAFLRRANFMRQVSGQGSDLDRTERTLREEENAARKRGGDDDGLLVGLLLMKRKLPATLMILMLAVM